MFLGVDCIISDKNMNNAQEVEEDTEPGIYNRQLCHYLIKKKQTQL